MNDAEKIVAIAKIINDEPDDNADTLQAILNHMEAANASANATRDEAENAMNSAEEAIGYLDAAEAVLADLIG